MSVQIIIDANLCTACGSCVASCPVDAIQIKETVGGFLTASICADTCIHCEKCLRVCPSHASNGVGSEFEDPFHGTVINAYSGYASDPEFRANGQSGGVVTALLDYLFRQGELDSALVNHFDPNTQRPTPFWAHNREDLLNSSGSYYVQSSMLSAIPPYKGHSYAAVLLGCQSEGLHLLRQQPAAIPMPEYVFGLVCAGQNSGKMIDRLVAQQSKTPASTFRFRAKGAAGWPGNVQFTSSGVTHIVPKEQRLLLKKVFESHRCLMCFDQMNVYSDIVFGDPWGIPENHVPEGYTVFITRTQKGDTLVRRAIHDGAIHAQQIDPIRIFAGQTVDTRCKDKFAVCRKWCEQESIPHPNALFACEAERRTPVAPKFQRDIVRRLTFTKQYSAINDPHQLEHIVDKALTKHQLQAEFAAPINFIIRCLSFVKRRLLRMLRH